MRRSIQFLVVLTAVVLLASGLARVPEALAHLDAFQVQGFVLEGNRYLTLAAAVTAIAVAPEASVWDEADTWEARLERHPLVSRAAIGRKLPGILVLRVEEEQPVALVPNPTLGPVDRTGRPLPIDPAEHSLDLPILQPHRGSSATGTALTPTELSALAGEVARLSAEDPQLLANVSEFALDEGSDLIARIGEPSVDLRFRVGAGAHRLRVGMVVLEDWRARAPDKPAYAIDLRYADQVVVRYSQNGQLE